MTSASVFERANPRTTALGALAIFVPLFVLLLWWGFSHRHVPSDPEVSRNGTLSVGALLVASGLAAGGPSLLLAAVLANHGRLRAVFHPRAGIILTAIGLAMVTPSAVLSWFPFVDWTTALIVFLQTPLNKVTTVFLTPLPVLAAFVVGWYFATALLIAGIRSKRLRFAGFCLVWWSIYGGILLESGYQRFSFP